MKQQEGIKAIFFDAAGTLLRVRGSVGEIYSRMAQRYGAQTNPEALNKSFKEAFASLSKSFSNFAPLEGAARRWWLELVRRVLADSIPPEKLEPCFEELFDYFRTADAWSAYPEVKESLTRLRAQGIRLGIVSNFDSRLRDVLNKLDIGPFEHIALSWEVGAAKPDPRIFLSALQALQISPGQALHVGDSIGEDVQGARNSGLIPVLLDRRRMHMGWTECPVIHGIDDLASSL